MNKDKFMLGVDIGTTSTKAVLYRETGEIITDENNGYALSTPDISTAEQDPEEIFHAVLLSIRNVMTKAKIAPNDLISEEHTSELQSRGQLVWRLLLEAKNA